MYLYNGANNKDLARFGENLAVQEVEKLGYEIIQKNYSCPIGEIDIVAKHNNMLVFIEVKTRKSQFYGMPQEAVNRRKQEKICRVASWFIKEYHFKDVSIRFDVVSVLLKKSSFAEVQIISGAFSGNGAL